MRTREYANNSGGCGPEYSTLKVYQSGTTPGNVGFRVRYDTGTLSQRESDSVWLDRWQVDDLIEQLCALRGFDSPVRPRTTRPAFRTMTRPRVERVPGLSGDRGYEDLILWIDENGGVLGWWVDKRFTKPSPGEDDSRGMTMEGWEADPCSGEAFVNDPHYLRALAALHERPTETVTKAVAVEGPVNGVSGDDFTTEEVPA